MRELLDFCCYEEVIHGIFGEFEELGGNRKNVSFPLFFFISRYSGRFLTIVDQPHIRVAALVAQAILLNTINICVFSQSSFKS